MENNQNFQQKFLPDFPQDFQNDSNDAQVGDARYFQVTYLDADCGRIRTESFDDEAAADRFASRCVAGEEGWAVVDAILAKERRAAA